MGAILDPPDLAGLLAPILPALPSATISTEPALGILPLLSPILRQRVKLFSGSSTEPWIRLLCYDTSKVAKLAEVVRSGNLEPHPVSGEVEVDWSYDAQTKYRRLDQETIQALTVLSELGLAFQLVYCVNDAEGGGDGWRVGELTVADTAAPFSQFGGLSTISEAEAQFTEAHPSKITITQTNGSTTSGEDLAGDDDEDDDGYWDRYDATPARTPANNRSPAPQTGLSASTTTTTTTTTTAAVPSQPSLYNASAALDDDDDDYYAQYDDVQPAMDNHDPDEEAQLAQIEPPLGLGGGRSRHNTTTTNPGADLNETRGSWTFAELDTLNKATSQQQQQQQAPDSSEAFTTAAPGDLALLHPRPESSASSNGSHTVAKLEASAGRQEQNEFGVKQHVSRSIRSLFLLARSSGIEREEFESLVKSEMDVLAMVEDQN